MITAVDSNVLIDVLEPDPRYGPASAAALRAAAARGGLIACAVVWAEVSGRFEAVPAVEEALDRLAVEFSVLEARQATDAGAMMAEYRRRGGTRARIVADFLVGAHARGRADRLLTRDRGFYRAYFAGLEIFEPGAS